MTRKAMTVRMISAGSTSCPKSLPMRDIMVDVGSFQPYFQQVVHCEGLSGAPRWTVQYDGSGPREVFTGLSFPALWADHRKLVFAAGGLKT
jgi:hypothetical protein